MTTVIYILLGIVVLVVFLALIAPKTYNVSRTIEIDSPKANVFPYLKFLNKQSDGLHGPKKTRIWNKN